MNFNAKHAVDQTVNWIRNWFEENGPTCNAIIGISGGKDSSITAALLVRALGQERVFGVLMPNGLQEDLDMGELLVNHLGIDHAVINIKEGYDHLRGAIEGEIGDLSRDSLINMGPRIRMTTLYAVAQSKNGRVANTCNLSEDWVGYSTRYGDSVGDFSPISSFTTAEIRAMGRELGLPEVLVAKTPTDGVSGLSDEEKLGFTYETLDRYIRTGEINDKEAKAKIDRLHRINLFKLRYMDCFRYEGVSVKAE